MSALHRELLRQMVVVWDPTEAGAPVIDPAAPYGSSKPWNDVQRIAERNGVKVSKADAIRLHRETEAALRTVLQRGALAPGRYSLPDPVGGRKSPFAGISLFDLAESTIAGGLRTHPPHERGRTLQLDFSSEHRKLLQAASVEWREWSEEDGSWFDGPAVDPKRPYGDTTFIFLDMAGALGMAPARPTMRDDHGFTPDQLRRLGRLHHEMDLALQVFLRQAEVPAP